MSPACAHVQPILDLARSPCSGRRLSSVELVPGLRVATLGRPRWRTRLPALLCGLDSVDVDGWRRADCFASKGCSWLWFRLNLVRVQSRHFAFTRRPRIADCHRRSVSRCPWSREQHAFCLGCRRGLISAEVFDATIFLDIDGLLISEQLVTSAQPFNLEPSGTACLAAPNLGECHRMVRARGVQKPRPRHNDRGSGNFDHDA